MGHWGTLWIQTILCCLRVAAMLTQHGVDLERGSSTSLSSQQCPIQSGACLMLPGTQRLLLEVLYRLCDVSTDPIQGADCAALCCVLLGDNSWPQLE